jgi:hypothetical protein
MPGRGSGEMRGGPARDRQCAITVRQERSAPGGTRTHNTRILSPLPLPIGLLGRPVNGIPSRPCKWFGVPECPVDAAGPYSQREQLEVVAPLWLRRIDP